MFCIRIVPYLLWVRLWWKVAEVDPEVVVTPAVSVPKPSSSNGNWKGMVTGTRLPSIPKGVSGADVTFWLVTDRGDAMRVKGEAFASNDAPVVDCTETGIIYKFIIVAWRTSRSKTEAWIVNCYSATLQQFYWSNGISICAREEGSFCLFPLPNPGAQFQGEQNAASVRSEAENLPASSNDSS